MYQSQRIAPRWSTPDAAIREVIERPPLRMRSPSLDGIRATPESREEAMHAHTKVHAVLGQLSAEEREVLVRYAFRQSYRQIAEAMGFSDWKARQIHKRCWEPFKERLTKLGLVVLRD